MDSQSKLKRREIIGLGLITGIGAISGLEIKKVIANTSTKKVKMITASGEVVEVEERHLPPKEISGKVSNSELKKWMKGKKG